MTDGQRTITTADEHEKIFNKIRELYHDLFMHDGFGELKVTMRFLKKGQKEVIVICGKEYRYVVDYPVASAQKRQRRGKEDLRGR